MRSFLATVLVLSVALADAQCLDSLGLNDAVSLNPCETEVLLSLGGAWPHAGPKPVVSFRYGNKARSVGKAEFFSKILPWLRNGEHPAVQWYVLSEEERKSTGVVALAVAWSKVPLTKRTKLRAMNELMLDHRRVSSRISAGSARCSFSGACSSAVR